MSTNGIWVEKYRPNAVKNVMLPTDFRTFFENIVNNKNEIPNLLLYSSTPGSGKTTLAKALCNDIGADVLYLNISAESGIDVLRDVIQKFASTYSFNGKTTMKVVIMDEADGATPNLQRGLRSAIEEFASTCRFILTANYRQKLIPALLSRCQQFDFNMNLDTHAVEMIPLITKRACKILELEQIEHDETVVHELVSRNFPDTRTVYQLLQQQASMHGRITDHIFRINTVNSELWEHILRMDYTSSRKYISENGYDVNALYRPMFDSLIPMMAGEIRSSAIIIIADYMDKSTRTTDPEITVSACILSLMNLIGSHKQQQ